MSETEFVVIELTPEEQSLLLKGLEKCLTKYLAFDDLYYDIFEKLQDELHTWFVGMQELEGL